MRMDLSFKCKEDNFLQPAESKDDPLIPWPGVYNAAIKDLLYIEVNRNRVQW